MSYPSLPCSDLDVSHTFAALSLAFRMSICLRHLHLYVGHAFVAVYLRLIHDELAIL